MFFPRPLTAPLLGEYALEILAVWVVATFFFDCIHWALHKLDGSRWPLLAAIGELHACHHRFLGRNLVVHKELAMLNALKHLIPELLTELVGCTVFYAVFDWPPVLLVQLGFTGLVLFIVTALKGVDYHHNPKAKEPAATRCYFVNPPYHYQHHVHPEAYFSSYFTSFDILFGTGCAIGGRRFVVTGASGAFGAPLCKMLLADGAASVVKLRFGSDWNYESLERQDTPKLDEALANADVLILAHGSKLDQAMAANATSFVAMIERFKALTAQRQMAPEVWAVGSEIEASPVFGMKNLKVYKDSKVAFARHARRYYRDPSIIYRHIVPSAFTSPMGPGLMSGCFTAAVTLFLIKRGFRYVPVTYTGIALLNFGKFLFLKPVSAPGSQTSVARIPDAKGREPDADAA